MMERGRPIRGAVGVLAGAGRVVLLWTLPLAVIPAVRAGETYCWLGQDTDKVYCNNIGFDPSNPASLSADKFLDERDYRSDDSYAFAGMELVESTHGAVETNAARFELVEHWIDVYQRPHREGESSRRLLGRLRLGPFKEPFQWRLLEERGRAAFFEGTVGGFKAELRINADSLLMIRVHSDTYLAFQPSSEDFPVEHELESGGHVLLADGVGGVTLHPIGGMNYGDLFGLDFFDTAVYNAELETWFFHLSAGQNFWVSVFPPKRFNWEIARERIAWDYRAPGDPLLYPDEPFIEGIQGVLRTGFGDNNVRNTLLLQSESIWKHWNLGFEPTSDDELERVVRDADGHDMRVVVYASPHYFTKSHPTLPALSDSEFSPFPTDSDGDGVADTPPDPVYVPFGENSAHYIDAVRQLIDAHPNLGGIYLDEIYPLNLPESYALVLELRRMLEELGPERRILYHNSMGTAVNPWGLSPWREEFNLVHNPTTEAYVDFTVCGEEPGGYIEVRFDPDYLKYRVSGYNFSNSVGLLIYYLLYADPVAWLDPFAPNRQNGGDWFFESLARDVLALNGRLHYRTPLQEIGVKPEERKPEYANLRNTFERYWALEARVTDEESHAAFLASHDDASQVFGHSTGGRHLIGDFDGNGRDDLAFFDPGAVVEKSYGHSTMYLRLSTAEEWVPDFGWKSEVEEPGDRIVFHAGGDFFIGDFDGNGLEDFAFFDRSNHQMRIKLSAAPGFLPGAGWEGDWGHAGGDFYIGDFNGDRRDDFAFFEPSDLSMNIRLNTESGYVSTKEWSATQQPFGHERGAFYIGDFDGDGRDDFAFLEPGLPGRGDESMHILLNTEKGYVYGAGWGAGAFGDSGGEFVIGNFNCDEREDFLFFRRSDAFVRLRLNLEGFAYDDRTLHFPAQADRVLVGDFNGDGSDDAAYIEDPAAHPYYDRVRFTRRDPFASDGDGDGIADEVDTAPAVFSGAFSDEGGAEGTVTARGEQILSVEDALDPSDGVLIEASLCGDATAATVLTCATGHVVQLTAGDAMVVSCGSVAMEIIDGAVEVKLFTDQGGEADAVLDAGNAFVFDESTSTLLAAATNDRDVRVAFEGREYDVGPGETLSLRETSFIRGDCNGDRAIDLSDGVAMLEFAFLGRRVLPCMIACDFNASGSLDITTAIYIFSHLFLGGAPPPFPFPECGTLEAGVRLSCETPPTYCL